MTSILTPKEKEAHVLDTAFENLRAQYDEAMETDLTPEEKLQLLQDPFAEIGNVLRSAVSDETVPEQIVAPEVVTKSELAEILNPLTEQLSLLIAQMEGSESAKTVRTATPQRRSISAQELRMKAPEAAKPGSIADIARQSTVGRLGY